MKKIIKNLLLGLSVLVIMFVVGGIVLPQKWFVQKNITINTDKETLYKQIANLKNWQTWSAWTLEKDPTQVYSYEGPEEGKGAKWNWASDNMGNGYLEITDAQEDWGMTYHLFIDMKGNTNNIYGTIKYSENNNQLDVIWIDEGDNGKNIFKKWLTIFIKSMLGKEMQAGLEKLKEITTKE